MHFMNSKYIAPLCLAVALLGARFQLAAATANNNNLWLSYVGDHSFFGSPLGGHQKVQNRLSDWGKDLASSFSSGRASTARSIRTGA
jgi:alkylation response protein AidB-like acyl-CoA dehydrogenase